MMPVMTAVTSMGLFLNAIDMVKFAKFVPSVNEMKDCLRLAWKFVDETKMVEQATVSA